MGCLFWIVEGILTSFMVLSLLLIWLPGVLPYNGPLTEVEWIGTGSAKSIESTELEWLKNDIKPTEGGYCNITIKAMDRRSDLVSWLLRPKDRILINVTFSPKSDIWNPVVILALVDGQGRVRGYSLCAVPFVFGVDTIKGMTSFSIPFLMQIPQEEMTLRISAVIHSININSWGTYDIRVYPSARPYMFVPQYYQENPHYSDTVELDTGKLMTSNLSLLLSTFIAFGGAMLLSHRIVTEKWDKWLVLDIGVTIAGIAWFLVSI